MTVDPSRPAPAPGGAGHGRHRRGKKLWRRPLWLAWFAVSCLLSGWLTVSMPVPQAAPSRAAAELRAEGVPAPALQEAETAARGGSSMASATHARQHPPEDAAGRLLPRLRLFGRLFLLVGLGAMLGAMIEGRRWYRHLAGTIGRLTRAARMPGIVAAAMPTALASAPAADSMLVASHRRGELSTATLVAGGMVNSWLAHFSHSMRIFYPVVAAIGLPGLAYFAIQFGGTGLFLAAVLVWHRVRAGAGPAGEAAGDAAAAAPQEPLPWGETLRRGLERALDLLFRLACVSVPMILAMEWIINAGHLSFWQDLVPSAVSSLFPEQMLAILAAQLGGLIPSSALCAGLRAQGLITGAQILLAMLIASVVTNPVRTLRRNLPTALGIFPPRAALVIVLGMQAVRLLTTLLAAVLLLMWMHAASAHPGP